MAGLRVLVGLAFVALIGILAGCGGGAAGGGEAPEPAADVGVHGTLTEGAGGITGMTLGVVDVQDSFDVAADAEAEVMYPGGGSATVPFSVIGRGKGIRFGEIPLHPGMNIIEIKAKKGYVIGFVHGRTHTVLFIGRLEVGIEMLDDGTIIAPTSFQLKVPTKEKPKCQPEPPPTGDPERQAIFRGLAPGDSVRGRVRDRFGAESVRDTKADSRGVAIINDYKGGVTTHNLSGPNSVVGFYFAEHADLLP
jgi:hypothetical protein